MLKGLATTACLLFTASSTFAETTPREGGFTVSNSVEVAAPPAQVWAALEQPGRWWDSNHSWSGDAANMTLEARAGGCFCEALAEGGSAMHGTVIFAQPNRTLRMAALLGTLMSLGGSAVLTWSIAPMGEGSRVTFEYVAGGLPGETGQALALPVDGVIRQQLERLERYVETGRPAA